MSLILVDEIKEHTSGAGILLSNDVKLANELQVLGHIGVGNPPVDFYGMFLQGPVQGDGVNYANAFKANMNVTAGQNNEVLVGVHERNIFSAGGFTNVSAYGIFVQDAVVAGLAYYQGIVISAIPGYGSIGNEGLTIGDVTGTGAFAIKTGLGTVSFGDPSIDGPANSSAQLWVFATDTVGTSQGGIYVYCRPGTGASLGYDGIFSQVEGPASVTLARLSSFNGAVDRGAGSTVTSIKNIVLNPVDNSGGTSAYQIYLFQITGTAGTNAGIFIDSVTGASVNNYGILIGNVTGTGAFSIKTGVGVVSIGDLLLTTASVAGGAKFRLPHGTAPSSPVDGDVWTTTAGIFVRINGVTVGPLT